MKISFCFSLLLLLFVGSALSEGCRKKENIWIPPEWDKHNNTYMVYPASAKIWKSEDNLFMVREDIVRIAKAIAKYEQVTMLVDPAQIEDAEAMIKGAKNIAIMAVPVDDLWARDTLPVFGYRGGEKELVGVDFNFNGWGNKQEHTKDGQVSRTLMKKLSMPRIETTLTGEGGSLETDGQGTLLVTESSIIYDNRNPTFNNDSRLVEKELKRVLGVKKVIWFKGVYKQDITDAHVDCLVRFVKPGVVILNRPFPGAEPDNWSVASDEAYEILKKETDARGEPFKVIEMFEPDEKKYKKLNDAFLASYVNFYIANGAVIVPKFGDKKADLAAQKILRDNFPDREVVAVSMPNLAAGGGGIHCATHDVPCYTESDGIRKECK